jgi:opacity protein-like surface antigen
MRRKLVGLAVTTLLIAAAARPAAAQARGYVGLGGGVNIPVGDFKNFNKTGWLGELIAGVTGKSGVLGGRIDGMYLHNTFKGGGGATKLFGANADVVWTPGKRPAKMHPYLLGGIGFFNVKNDDVANSETKFAWNAGAGLQVHTGNRMDFFVEGRFLTISTTGNSIHMIPLAIGLRWGGV